MIIERLSDLSPSSIFLLLPEFQNSFETYVKLEGLNPTGSIKFKTARQMIEAAEEKGWIGPGTGIIESTSGNLGVALAAICAAKGYPITLVTDPNANARSVRYIEALGADLVVVRERDSTGGYLQSRIDYIMRRCVEDPDLLWLNQYRSPANPSAHFLHTAAEIFQDFGVPDWLFVGTGTSGTLMGCVRYVQSVGAPTTVVAVDSEGSVTFGGPPARRWIPGLGSGRKPEIFQDDGSFHKVLVGEREAIRMCRRIAREFGLLLGGSSGTVLAAVEAFQSHIPRAVASSRSRPTWETATSIPSMTTNGFPNGSEPSC